MTGSTPPAIDDSDAFFDWLKEASEEHWSRIQINPRIYGFQMQPGTRWRPGLLDTQIDAYEAEMGFRFPDVFRRYLRRMNGTDTPTVNVYGSARHPTTYGPGFYTYPDDLPRVRSMLRFIYDDFGVQDKDFDMEEIPHIMPLLEHRCLVVDRCDEHPVLSVWGPDTIPWAPNLPKFLMMETVAPQTRPNPFTGSGRIEWVPFWLDSRG